jgi:hypothetical protein
MALNMKITCFNKVLRDIRPAEKVVSKDTLHWLEAVLVDKDCYETDFYIFRKAKE